MKKIMLGNKLEVPAVGLGCMRLTELKDKSSQRRLIDTMMDSGVNFFDHADIYGGGECETIFGEVYDRTKRPEMIIQTKCGIRPGVCYDFSKSYIIESVEGSLKRLKTDYIDILLLHRPDALMDGEEVAEAFDQLASQGKVRYFGVSNQNAMQLALMNHYCGGKIVADQLQFSIAHCEMIDAGLNVNIHNDAGCDRDGGVIEYCRMNGITIQAWSPFQYGMFEGCFIGSPKFPKLNEVLARLAKKYETSANAIAIAWILRHPANMQAIVGSTNAERMAEICRKGDVRLTREEWYELYLAAGKMLP